MAKTERTVRRKIVSPHFTGGEDNLAPQAGQRLDVSATVFPHKEQRLEAATIAVLTMLTKISSPPISKNGQRAG